MFIMGVISLMMGKMVPILARAMKDKEFEYNFLTICRYLNLVKIRG